METINIENMWNQHSSNLQTNLDVNFTSLKNAKFKSTRTQLNGLIIRRALESLFFLSAFVLLIRFTILNNEPQYILSGIALAFFTIIGAIGSLWQIIIIAQLDYDKPVANFLMQLGKLRLYSLQTLRLLILSVPFYFAYIIIGFKVFFKVDIYGYANMAWLVANFIFSLMLVPISIYLVKQLRTDTKKNWVKQFIADNGGNQIDAAIQFMTELIEFKNNEPSID